MAGFVKVPFLLTRKCNFIFNLVGICATVDLMTTHSEQFEITIGSRKVGPGHPPFIIAEISGNHNQSLQRALELVDLAALAGAHAVKLQTYTADTITIDHKEGDFWISDPESLWKGESLYDLYKKAYTPWEWHQPIFQRCREKNLIFFSTPFDETAIDLLEKLDVPCYKIASFENVHLPLIAMVAKTGKPLIISTGLASMEEVQDAVDTARANGCKDLILLKCTSSYPAPPRESNLRTIPDMKERFQVQVGLSDHTLGIGVAVGSVAFGATVIEKHFILSRAEGGVDSAFSLEPQELKSLVEESERAWLACGEIHYGPGLNEAKSLQYRRSIYVVEDISAGAVLNEKNIRIIRPGRGLKPKFYAQILGKQVNKAIKRGEPITWEDIQK
jgi:pseudaminic acid synthase